MALNHHNTMKKPLLYIQLPGVKVDENNFPEELRCLVPMAKKWCYVNEDALYQHLNDSGLEQIEAFVTACKRSEPKLGNYCFETAHPCPVPHEAVLLQIMFDNYMAANSILSLRKEKGASGK